MASLLFLVSAALYPCSSAQTYDVAQLGGTCDIQTTGSAFPASSARNVKYCSWTSTDERPFDDKCCSSQDSCSYPDVQDKCCEACSRDPSCTGFLVSSCSTCCSGTIDCTLYYEPFDIQQQTGGQCGFTVGVKATARHCKAPDDCYHEQWAVPCSFAGTEERCVESGGVWEGGVSPTPSPVPTPTPPPTPTPSPTPSHHCTAPDDCYHEQWGVPCSFAGTEERCVNSGGVWEGGAQGKEALI